jgi:hypothetical protein
MDMQFRQIEDDELRKLLQEAATGDPVPAHNFFARFPYNAFITEEKYLETLENIIWVLQKLKSLDEQAYQRIHKGTPFYWGAMTAFRLHDYQSATFFFDAAATEDRKNDRNPDTPALLFMKLNSQNPNQAAREFTAIAERRLISLIDEYNRIPGSRPLTIENVRNCFLTPAVMDEPSWRTLVTSWISFILEWEYRLTILDLRVEHGTSEPFFIHLFKGCVLFESTLKANPAVQNPGSTLERILNHNGSIQQRLGINGRIRTSGPEFADVMNDLPRVGNNIQSNMEFVARVRNTIGHNIGWDTQLTSAQYIQLVRRVAVVILHALAGLY